MSSVVEQTTVAPPPAKPRRSTASILQGAAIALGFVVFVGSFVLIAVEYRPYRVPTTSMSPTIQNGDTVLARKANGSQVGRGDIVVFKDAAWSNETMVKRVVAVGGDRVVCCDNERHLTVNGISVAESYVDTTHGPGASFDVTVPDGRLFVLGDFRLNSLDSRSHLDVSLGTVPTGDVMGRVEARILPLSRAAVPARTTAFDALGGPAAHGSGPLQPALYGVAGGAALVMLAAVAGWLVSLRQRLRQRRKA